MGLTELFSRLDRRVLGAAKPYRDTRRRDLWLMLGIPVAFGALMYSLLAVLDNGPLPAVALGPAVGGVIGGLIGYRLRRRKDRTRRERLAAEEDSSAA